MENDEQNHDSSTDRRSFFRKLVGVAAATGISGLLLGKLAEPVSAASSGEVAFFTSGSTQSGDNNLFWNNSLKRLGVDTSAPEAQMHIGGSATADVFCGIGPHPGTLVSGQYVGPAMNYGYSGSSFGRGSGFFNVRPDPSAVAPNPSLRFMTNNVQAMIITNTGQVGIGTSTPNAALSFGGGQSTKRANQNRLHLYDGGNIGQTWDKYGFGIQSLLLQMYSGSVGDFAFGNYNYDTDTFTEHVRFTGIVGPNPPDPRGGSEASASVGIGRIPTTNRLEVEGDASKTVAGSWLANSDMRIKTEIDDIDDALATIRKLHPVRFKYTPEYRTKHPSIKDHPYYNFIAQEYREVFPDSVQDDGEGLLQMDSYNVTPYLVAAFQQLQEEFKNEKEKLQERIAILERTVKQLTAS